jgi:hypothetical protein
MATLTSVLRNKGVISGFFAGSETSVFVLLAADLARLLARPAHGRQARELLREHAERLDAELRPVALRA